MHPGSWVSTTLSGGPSDFPGSYLQASSHSGRSGHLQGKSADELSLSPSLSLNCFQIQFQCKAHLSYFSISGHLLKPHAAGERHWQCEGLGSTQLLFLRQCTHGSVAFSRKPGTSWKTPAHVTSNRENTHIETGRENGGVCMHKPLLEYSPL